MGAKTDYEEAHGALSCSKPNMDAPLSREVLEALGFRGEFAYGNPKYPHWSLSQQGIGDSFRVEWSAVWTKPHPSARELIEAIRDEAAREARNEMRKAFRAFIGLE